MSLRRDWWRWTRTDEQAPSSLVSDQLTGTELPQHDWDTSPQGNKLALSSSSVSPNFPAWLPIRGDQGLERGSPRWYTLVFPILRTRTRPPTENHTRTRLLLGRKKRGFGQGSYNGFGGKVETSDQGNVRFASVRELREETGLEVEPARLEECGQILLVQDEGEEVQIWVFRLFLSAEDVEKASGGRGTSRGTADDLSIGPETDEMASRWFDLDPQDSLKTVPLAQMRPESSLYLGMVLSPSSTIQRVETNPPETGSGASRQFLIRVDWEARKEAEKKDERRCRRWWLGLVRPDSDI